MKLLLKKSCCNNRVLQIKHSLLLYLALCGFNATAQVNLINNPSFEDTTNIFISPNLQDCVKYWTSLDSTRPQNCAGIFQSYYSPDPNNILPINGNIQTDPRSGSNIANVRSWWWVSFFPPWETTRTIIKSRLKNKLVANKKYCTKMYAWLANHQYQSNGLGMYFDNGMLDTIVAKDISGVYPFVQAQVYSHSVLNTALFWNLISGTFVANGSETHINIGNYLSDATVDTINVIPGLSFWAPSTEYGIDDVSLIPVDIANWLHDTACAIGDSVYIGLPKYEVPDAIWYTANGTMIDTASGIRVHPTQAVTQYIQAIDVCDRIAYDTVTVYAYPLSIDNGKTKIENGMLAYPNPTKETFVLEKVYGKQVQLINMLGEIVLVQEVVNGMAVFEVAHLPKGTYYLKGERQVGKIVVE
jgi:hypothetical protein